MTIPDPIAELIVLLEADTDVIALAGDNIFGGSLTADAKQNMPQPAIVVAPAGGPGRRGYTNWRRQRVDTTCYGATLTQSWLLHLAVREVLENLQRNGSLFWAETLSDGTNAIDPRTQWPTCFATYMVASAAEA